ncbi:hypothetical protein HZB00_04360 [Candidatus Woesearchaeota archaeon]|nr:hypothetical protein [Candidatus Woesearchaeota archaeon]
MTEEYISVEEGLEGKVIPFEQALNVRRLQEIERRQFDPRRTSLTEETEEEIQQNLLHFYKDRSAGRQNIYYALATSSGVAYMGYTDFYGVASQVREFQRIFPNAPILVHGMGTALDFDLVHHLPTREELYAS